MSDKKYDLEFAIEDRINKLFKEMEEKIREEALEQIKLLRKLKKEAKEDE